MLWRVLLLRGDFNNVRGDTGMNIIAADLKRSFKKLAPVKSEAYIIGDFGVLCQDSDVWVVVESPLSGLEPCSVSGKKLAATINRMSGTVEITQQEKSVVLKSAKARIELEAQKTKPTVLPKIPDKLVSFHPDEFKKAL